MRAILFTLGLVFICGQAATYWLWNQGSISSFSNIYASFSTEQPLWTGLVFSTWQLWWLAPTLSIALLVYATYAAKSKALQVFSVAAAMLILGGMWYAMYPLHAMVKV